jgi:hypothetical protein
MFFLDVTDPSFSYAAPLLQALVGLAVAVVTAATPILVHALVVYLRKKTQIEVSKAAEEKVAVAAGGLVLRLEQEARKQLKLGNGAPDGAKKMELAVKAMEQRLKELGLYDQFKDRMVDLIEEAVGGMNGPLLADEKEVIRNSLPPEIEIEDEKTKPAIKPLPKKKIGESK